MQSSNVSMANRHQPVHVKVPPPRRAKRWLRYLFYIVLGVAIANIALIGVVLVFFHFNRNDQGMVNNRVQTALQEAVGPNFSISVESSGLTLDLPGAIAILSQGLEITDKLGRERVTIRQLNLRIQPISFFGDEKKFSLVSADGVVVKSVDGGNALPKSFANLLNQAGAGFDGLQNAFNREEFTQLILSDLKLVNAQGTSALHSAVVEMHPLSKAESVLTFTGMLNGSEVTANGKYQRLANSGARLVITAGGINTATLFSPVDQIDNGLLGLESIWDVQAIMPFAHNGRAEQPLIKLTSGAGRVRLGKSDPAIFNGGHINMRFLPNQEQFEVERSSLSFESLEMQLTGHLWPRFLNEGYHGPLEFALKVEQARARATTKTEKPVLLQMQSSGSFESATKTLAIPKLTLVASAEGEGVTDGHIEGQAKLVFGDKSPAVDATFDGGGIPFAAVRQYWPSFLSPKAREWVRKSVFHGTLEKAGFAMSAPTGLLDKVREKTAFFDQNQMSLTASGSGISVVTFGNLPPVTKARGQFVMLGKKLAVSVDQAQIAQARQALKLTSGSVIIDDVAAKPSIAQLQSDYSGSTAALYAVLINKPIDLDKRLNVSNPKLSGTASGSVSASFPIVPKIRAEDVEWSSKSTFKDFGSDIPLFDHTVSKGNLSVLASQYGVEVQGKATMDGTIANIDVAQPFGTSGKVKKNTEVSVVLDAAARKRLGLDFSSFLTGTIMADVEEVSPNTTRETLDLKKAELSIDAMGWKKGAGVPAKATYTRTAEKGLQKINHLVVSGQGFSLKGSLVLNKAGLVSAKLSHVALNKGDSGSLTAHTRDGIIEINFTAKSWDGRGFLTKLFHKGGFKEAQSGASINLQASIGSVTGFNQRRLTAMKLTYKIRKGALRSLDLNSSVGTSKRRLGAVTVQAERKSPHTKFIIRSDSAGDTLAFIDIYERMVGGQMDVRLNRDGNGPYYGPVLLKNFKVIDEPRLSKLVASKTVTNRDEITNKLKSIKTKRVNFIDAKTMIEKGDNYLKVSNGTIRANEFGIVYEGVVYDRNNQMNIRGTFLPAFALSMAVSAIPVVGQIFSNGKDSGLFGITYKLEGPAKDPRLIVNPMSIVAPGIFNKVFEFRQ